MKRFIILFFAVSVASLFIQAAFEDGTQIPNTAYQSGENLRYVVSYGWIEGGEASLSLKEIKLNGKTVHHAVANARTLGITDKVYKVRDIYESYIDAESGLPIKSIRNVKEGGYEDYNEVIFNHINKTAKSKKTGEHKIVTNIQDMVSVFYFARRTIFHNIKAGQVLTLNTFFEDKIYPLQVRFKGYDKIKTKFGKVKCLKFSPVVEPGRVFDSEDDLEVWISNDGNFIPVRIQMNLVVGAVVCDLVEQSGLKNKFGE